MSTNPENGPIPSYTPSSTTNSEPQPQSAPSGTSSSQQWQQQAPGPNTTGNQWAPQQGNWQQPAGAQPQQQWGQPQYASEPRQEPKGFARVFDFSFKRFALEDGTGVIFIVITVLLALRTLFGIASMFEYQSGAYLFLNAFSSLLQLVLYLLLIRVGLELATAAVKLWVHTEKSSSSEDEKN